ERIAAIDKDLTNPLMPEYFVNCFLTSLSDADVDIHSKMLVLRLFEGQVYSKLESYVREVNDVLIAADILPDLDTLPSDTTLIMNAIVDDALGESSGGVQLNEMTELEIAFADLQVDDFEEMDRLVSVERALSWQGSESIRDLLSELKQKQLAPENLSRKAQMQLESVELVGTLFQYILSDNELPVVAKSLIANLQLPYTRIALADSAFFQDDNHPARELLGIITKLCTNWQPNDQSLALDMLYKKIVMAIQVFIEAERTTDIDYRGILFEFLAYEEAQRQKSVQSTQRMVDSEYGVTASEKMRAEVSQLLDEKIKDIAVPDAGMRILTEGWNHVLYMYAIKHGVDSDEWLKAAALIDSLLFTLQPAEKYSSRTELLVALPELLRSLREGFSSIDMGSSLIKQLFKDLEEEHKRLAVAIGGAAAADEIFVRSVDKPIEEVMESETIADTVIEEDVIPSSVEVSEPEIQQEPEQNIEVDPEPEPEPEPEKLISTETLEKIAMLNQGSWLLWNREDEQVRCQIAAFIKHTKKYILTDRNSAKVAEFSEDEMIILLETGEIETVATEQRFERALESVIGSMRDKH
ncbi:MAG: DUF1631 domain-containing protein, partial [bacterium]|nr:DUF1631 domain-containing protein [bacterium]